MPTIKVILNPVSGRGAGQRTAEAIRHTLTEAKATFEIVETTGQRSAMAQAAQAVREGWDIIAAVGGDGSANEVLNGIASGCWVASATHRRKRWCWASAEQE